MQMELMYSLRPPSLRSAIPMVRPTIGMNVSVLNFLRNPHPAGSPFAFLNRTVLLSWDWPDFQRLRMLWRMFYRFTSAVVVLHRCDDIDHVSRWVGSFHEQRFNAASELRLMLSDSEWTFGQPSKPNEFAAAATVAAAVPPVVTVSAVGSGGGGGGASVESKAAALAAQAAGEKVAYRADCRLPFLVVGSSHSGDDSLSMSALDLCGLLCLPWEMRAHTASASSALSAEQEAACDRAYTGERNPPTPSDESRPVHRAAITKARQFLAVHRAGYGTAAFEGPVVDRATAQPVVSAALDGLLLPPLIALVQGYCEWAHETGRVVTCPPFVRLAKAAAVWPYGFLPASARVIVPQLQWVVRLAQRPEYGRAARLKEEPFK
jgi:hypothetical protein